MPTSPPFSVLLVDDHRLVTDGVARLLRQELGLTELRQADTAAKALALLQAQPADLLLTDLHLRGQSLSGFGLCRRVRVDFPEIKFITLTMSDDPEHVRAALLLGASGYVLKEDDPDELLRAVEAVRRGDERPFFSRSLVPMLLKPGASSMPKLPLSLTPRELEILPLIAREFTNEEIAQSLHPLVSVKTVETHRRNLIRKLGVRSAVGLANFVFRYGLDGER